MNPGGPLQPPQTSSITAPTSNQQISIIQPSQIQNNGQYFYQIVNPQVQPQFSVIGLQGLQGLQGLYPYGLVQNGLKPTPVQGFQVLQGPQNVSNLQLAIPQIQAVHVQASPQLFIQAGELQQQAALPPGAARPGENADVGEVKRRSLHKQKNKKKNEKKQTLKMDEDEAVKVLPDYLKNNLDIVFINPNPSLHSAWSGRYFDGPGEQFWDALFTAGLVTNPTKACDDHNLLKQGIGFTNIVARTIQSAGEISREELMEGSSVLRAKLIRFKPKIAVFYGKLIYEVFSGRKKFMFGLQPENTPGSDIVEWVIPSTWARGTGQHKDGDEVPYFSALKKYLYFLKGIQTRPPDSELIFSSPSKKPSSKKVREEFILRKDEILKGEFKNKGDSPEKPSPGKKEELPSTSVRKFNSGTEIKDSLKMDDSSDDELEMPVLQAEIPFPTKPVKTNQSSPLQSINPGPKSKQPDSKPINQTNSSKQTKQVFTPKNETSLSTKSSFPQTSKPVNTKNPSPKRNLTKQERDEGSSTSNWQESYEKPKTSEKCYKKQKISLSSSSSSDSDSEMEAQTLEDTNALFEKLIQSNSAKNSKGGSASNLKKVVPPSTNSKGVVSPFSKGVMSPFSKGVVSPSSKGVVSPSSKGVVSPSSKGVVSPSSKGVVSPSNRQISPRGSPLKYSPAKCEGMTSIWGKDVSSFDLPEDYVKDYLKEKKATKLDEGPELEPTLLKTSPNLLMIAPLSSKVKSRTGSLDIIPACLPESVGVEIEDILQSGFDGEEGYTLSPISTGSTQSRVNKTKGSPVGKNKKCRNKSTDNLHPNLLPEDYLDEVIGQYFNTESSGEDEEDKETKKPVKTPKKSDSEDSTDDDVLEAKVRLRPPASFYSMDFLDDLEAEVGKKEKVKTELELEVEYKHILYGGKKKKPVKLGLGKKKKKKEDSKETTESRKPGVHKTKRKGRRKVVKKRDPVPESAETVLPRTRSSGPVPASPSPIPSSSRSFTRATNPTSPIPSSSRSSTRSTSHPSLPRSSSKPSPTKQLNRTFSPTPSEPLPSHAWSGKKASTKAYVREDMRERIKRPFTSSKIEDVTGKYGEEEELVSCGICDQIDPPHEDLPLDKVEVEWVGCDCFRWFHKPCTKLMKFTEKFSCRSVKMKCLETPPAPVKIKPVLPVVKTAVVKFVPDIPRFFIKNI